MMFKEIPKHLYQEIQMITIIRNLDQQLTKLIKNILILTNKIIKVYCESLEVANNQTKKMEALLFLIAQLMMQIFCMIMTTQKIYQIGY